MQSTSTLLGVFTSLYSLARKAGLLNKRWFRRIFVASYFTYKRLFEDPFWVLIKEKPELFQNGDVIDVGANIGYTSLLFSRVLQAGSKVYSFEPDNFNFEVLNEVIEQKQLLDKVVPINAAVGAFDGSVELWHNEQHHGDHKVATKKFKASHSEELETLMVPMTSIDSFVRARRLQRISFVKIDVQGYELPVCEGMAQTLIAFPEMKICFEYAPQALRELGFEPGQLLAIFRDKGYHVYVISKKGVQLDRDNQIISQGVEKRGYIDLLCSKEELD